MDIAEQKPVDAFLRTLPQHAGHARHVKHVGHPHGKWSQSRRPIDWYARGPATQMDRYWALFPAAPGKRATTKGRARVAVDTNAVLDLLKQKRVQSLLADYIEQWQKGFQGIAEQLSEVRGTAGVTERLEALEDRVKLLESQVAHLEQRPEVPSLALTDEGDPFALLRELRAEIGDERFDRFVQDE